MNMCDMDLKEFRKVALEWSGNTDSESKIPANVSKQDFVYYWNYLKSDLGTGFVPLHGANRICGSRFDYIFKGMVRFIYHPPFINGGTRVVIDYVETYISEIHGDFAKGFTLLSNSYSARKCYVCRKKVPGSETYLYAHGNTMREAFLSLSEKFESFSSLEERFCKFRSNFPDLDAEYKASDLYYWHGVITGSCSFGRNNFCEKHGIDVNNDKLTLREFFKLVLKEDNYGNERIRTLSMTYR